MATKWRAQWLAEQGGFPASPDTCIPVLLTPVEVLRVVPIGRTTLYEKMNSGELPYLSIGTRRYVRATDVAAWIERLTAEATRNWQTDDGAVDADGCGE